MYTMSVRKKQPKDTTDLGRFMLEWRNDNNLTVEEAAGRAEIVKSTWTKLENGQKKIALETLFALSQLTGRTMEDLLSKLGRKVHRSQSSEERGRRMAALAEAEPLAAKLIDLLPDLTPGQIDTMLTVGEGLRQKDQR